MLESPDRYHAHEQAWTARRDAERRRSAVVARFRLATFLGGLAATVWWLGFAGGVPAFFIALVLYLVFGTLVILHSRIEDRAEWFEALRVVNARAAARVARRWDALPDAAPPPGVLPENHPYAVDLDLFGYASAFQLVGPASMPGGHHTLAAWLLSPALPEEIRRRQAAVDELAALDEWREHLSALGTVAGASRSQPLDVFFEWAEGSTPPMRGYAVVRIVVYLLVVWLWTLLLLDLTGVRPNNAWGVPLILSIILSFFTAYPVTKVFDRAGSGERTLRQHAALLAHVSAQSFQAAALQFVTARLSSAQQTAPEAMRALNRILAFSELRRGAALLHFPIQAFTLWDFHWVFALERWRRRSGVHVRDWFAAAGEIDALACLAALRRDNPDWAFPELTQARVYRATALGHPLLPAARRVSNDVQLGPPGSVLLVTGSNMSGKSTLLRAMGLNGVLAQCGAPVCATKLSLPATEIQTSIRIQDSLERGVSYFMAALARLKGVVDAAERTDNERVLLYLLDEILQGTNSAERGTAVQAVARHLLDAGAIGAMTTHDLNLAFEEPLKSRAKLVHFTEIVDPDGTMHFDYTLREGLATSRNALRLMELIGISVPQP